MAKYTGTNMVATFGATTFNCLTSLDWNGTANVITQACAGSDSLVRVVGSVDNTFTLNFLLDDSGYTEITNLNPGTTGTFTASINGTLGPTFLGAAYVQTVNLTSPSDGFVAGTVTVGIDGDLTQA